MLHHCGETTDQLAAQPQSPEICTPYPNAFESATHGSGTQNSYPHRLAMLHHLLQSLHLDANASDQTDGWQRGPCWGTPLCYVAHSSAGQRDVKEVVWALMDTGPLPEVKGLEWSALEMAQQTGNTAFVEVVDEWRAAS